MTHPPPPTHTHYDKIRSLIEFYPIYQDIKSDKILGRCVQICSEILPILVQNLNSDYKFEIVDGLGIHDHSWIQASHPEVGIFMIDPTIRQIIYNSSKSTKEFEHFFIGMRQELIDRFRDGQYIALSPNPDDPFTDVWTEKTRVRTSTLYETSDASLGVSHSSKKS